MVRIKINIQVIKAANTKERSKDIARNVPLTDMDYVDVTYQSHCGHRCYCHLSRSRC
nr:hypothetical protein [Streptococcus agalactiae]